MVDSMNTVSKFIFENTCREFGGCGEQRHSLGAASHFTGARCSFVPQTEQTSHTQRSLLSFIINSTLNYLRMLRLVLEEAYAVYKMSGYDERSNLAQLRRGEIMEGGALPHSLFNAGAASISHFTEVNVEREREKRMFCGPGLPLKDITL